MYVGDIARFFDYSAKRQRLLDRCIENCESIQIKAKKFKKQLAEAMRIGKQLHGDEFELRTPRISGRQSHRSNPPSSTPEEYYQITLYDEFLSHVASKLEERFVRNPSQSLTIGLLHLLPSECVKLDNGMIIPKDLD